MKPPTHPKTKLAIACPARWKSSVSLRKKVIPPVFATDVILMFLESSHQPCPKTLTSLGGTVLTYGYARSKSFVVSNGGGLNDVPGTGPKQRMTYGHPN